MSQVEAAVVAGGMKQGGR